MNKYKKEIKETPGRGKRCCGIYCIPFVNISKREAFEKSWLSTKSSRSVQITLGCRKSPCKKDVFPEPFFPTSNEIVPGRIITFSI